MFHGFGKIRLRGVGIATALLTLLSSPAATAREFAYFRPFSTNGYAGALIDWQSANRARYVGLSGAASGQVSRLSANQRLITLDAAISVESNNVDSCGELVPARLSILQVAVRDVSGGSTRGDSDLVELGTWTFLAGCDEGSSVPFGSPADEGVRVRRLAMSVRPAVTDLVAGTRLAGLSESPWTPGALTPDGVDVATFNAGSVTFAGSGNTQSAAFDSQQWLVLALASGERAYTRVEVDNSIGGEIWLLTERSAGLPTRLSQTWMVKPAGNAGFGAEARTTRMWQSGLSVNSPTPFLWYLYAGGTGENVSKDLDLGTESRTPITWRFEGSTLLLQRGTASSPRERKWVPLKNQGPSIRWVMENEDRIDPFTGVRTPFILPRVNYVLDTGPAMPLPTRPR